LHVTSKEDAFADLFLSRVWDFVVTDWLKGPHDPKDVEALRKPVGKTIIFSIHKSAAEKSRHVPIFIITNFPQEAADIVDLRRPRFNGLH
jgi:hypothetical protein